MAKRDKYAFLIDELGSRLAAVQSLADSAKGGGKAKFTGEIEALEYALETVKKVFDRRTKVLACPNGHRFEVGLFKSVKEGIACTECGTPAFKILKKSKPAKAAKPTALPSAPTMAEIENAALKHAEQKQAAEGKRRKGKRTPAQ